MKQGRFEWEHPPARKSRWVLWSLLVLLGGLVMGAWVTPVQVYALAPGALEPRGQLLRLTAPTSGRLTFVGLQSGESVQKGQHLFTLDGLGSSPEEARLQLETSRAQAEEAARTLAQVREQLAQRQRIAQLQTRLYTAGAIARVEYLEALENLRQSEAAVRVAEARVATLKAQTKALESRRTTRVFSPASGRVLSLSGHRTGESVMAGQILAEILPQDVPLVFKAYLPERERPKLRRGALAEVAWNAFPRQRFGTSRGTVIRISPTTVVYNNQAVYELEIALESLQLASAEGSRQVVPGMVGEARIVAARRSALSLFWDWVRGVNPWG